MALSWIKTEFSRIRSETATRFGPGTPRESVKVMRRGDGCYIVRVRGRALVGHHRSWQLAMTVARNTGICGVSRFPVSGGQRLRIWQGDLA